MDWYSKRDVKKNFHWDRVEESARLNVNAAFLVPYTSSLMRQLYREDYATWRHCCDVAFSAAQISLILEISDSDVFEITQGALLHDVGKLEVPADILNKPSALSADERFIINQHPVMGQRLVSGYGYSDIVMDIILHHHENEIGTGYPDGIKELPETTKIVAVADKFDALSEDRPYRSEKETFYAVMKEMEAVKQEFNDVDRIYDALYYCKGMRL